MQMMRKTSSSILDSLVLKNIQAVAELERRAVHERTRSERVTDAITSAAGSMPFIIGHVLAFVGWGVVNTASPHPFDPYPFSLLNLVVSLEAIVLTSFVLMTQNRMTQVADRRAHLDLQVNLLAEQELTTILQMLYALCQKAGTCVKVRDARVEALLNETDIVTLAVALEKELASSESGMERGRS